jgi:signal transduction histidine kinase
MDAPSRNRFVAWLKELEARGDAWAARRMTPEEYADATVLDRQIKENFWRWLGRFAVVVAFVGLIVLSIWPQLTVLRAMFYAAVGCLYLLAVFATAWYGWRKYTRKPAWRVMLFFVLVLLVGSAVGYVVGNLHSGRPLTQVDPAKGAKLVGIAVAVGLALAAVLVGIAQMRLREAKLRAARLEAEAERERLARQGAQAELKLLQAQVEPHFLFNTLANVRHLVQTGSSDALSMIDNLIRYLRAALPEIRSESSTLGREGELARAYLEIMRLRMGGELDYAVDIPAPIAQAPFPPLMLLTLVENAIKHGVAPVGRGRLVVRAAEVSGGVRVEVDDDGAGIGGPIGQGVGLANLRERLRALYGERARFDLAARGPTGACASIEVPA